MKRTYAIKITPETESPRYIKNFEHISAGYRFTSTNNLDNAKHWYYKKSIEKIMEKLSNQLEQSFKFFHEKCSYEIIETTPTKVLRYIKLKKLKQI